MQRSPKTLVDVMIGWTTFPKNCKLNVETISKHESNSPDHSESIKTGTTSKEYLELVDVNTKDST